MRRSSLLKTSADLWGVGYSNSPLNVPYTSRLFTRQITFAIGSSPLAWSASGPFSIVGYSLSGAIALDYVGRFPGHVDSVVLLAPGGLLPSPPKGYGDFAVTHPNLVPRPHLRKRVAELLDLGSDQRPTKRAFRRAQKTLLPDPTLRDSHGSPPRSDEMRDFLQWQFDHHESFVESFCNTVKHGPIYGQQKTWDKACRIMLGQAASPSPLRDTRLLVFFGDQDDIISGQEMEDLILCRLPAERVEFSYLPGGHGFPYPCSGAIVKKMADVWGLD